MKGAWAVKFKNSILSSNVTSSSCLLFPFSPLCVFFFFHLHSLHAQVLLWHVFPLDPLPASLVFSAFLQRESHMNAGAPHPSFFPPPSLAECSTQPQDPCVSTPLTFQRTLFASEQRSARVRARGGTLCKSVIFRIVCICHCLVRVCVCAHVCSSCSLFSLVAMLH